MMGTMPLRSLLSMFLLGAISSYSGVRRGWKFNTVGSPANMQSSILDLVHQTISGSSDPINSKNPSNCSLWPVDSSITPCTTLCEGTAALMAPLGLSRNFRGDIEFTEVTALSPYQENGVAGSVRGKTVRRGLATRGKASRHAKTFLCALPADVGSDNAPGEEAPWSPGIAAGVFAAPVEPPVEPLSTIPDTPTQSDAGSSPESITKSTIGSTATADGSTVIGGADDIGDTPHMSGGEMDGAEVLWRDSVACSEAEAIQEAVIRVPEITSAATTDVSSVVATADANVSKSMDSSGIDSPDPPVIAAAALSAGGDQATAEGGVLGEGEAAVSASSNGSEVGEKLDKLLSVLARTPLQKLREAVAALPTHTLSGTEIPRLHSSMDTETHVRGALAAFWAAGEGDWGALQSYVNKSVAREAAENTEWMKKSVQAGQLLSELKLKELVKKHGMGASSVPKKYTSDKGKRGKGRGKGKEMEEGLHAPELPQLQLKIDYLTTLIDLLLERAGNDYREVCSLLEHEAKHAKKTKGFGS